MRITTFLACDDIRQEIGNKVTLIGLYENRIRVQVLEPEKLQWPIHMRLAFYIKTRLDSKSEGVPIRFEFEVVHNGSGIARASGKVSRISETGDINLVVNFHSIPIPGEGKLNFNLQMMNDKGERSTLIPDLTMEISVERKQLTVP